MKDVKENDKNKTPDVQEQPVTQTPKFTVEKLGENCRRLFGVSMTLYAGATYGMTGEYTVEEMKRHIEVWKKKEVR